jgi:hypothetical protein
LSVQNRHALRRPKNFRSDEAPAAPARGSLPEAAGEEVDDANEGDLMGDQLLEKVAGSFGPVSKGYVLVHEFFLRLDVGRWSRLAGTGRAARRALIRTFGQEVDCLGHHFVFAALLTVVGFPPSLL